MLRSAHGPVSVQKNLQDGSNLGVDCSTARRTGPVQTLIAIDVILCFSAAEWKLDEPDWTGRLKVSAKGHSLCIRLEDKNTGSKIK